MATMPGKSSPKIFGPKWWLKNGDFHPMGSLSPQKITQKATNPSPPLGNPSPSLGNPSPSLGNPSPPLGDLMIPQNWGP